MYNNLEKRAEKCIRKIICKGGVFAGNSVHFMKKNAHREGYTFQ